MIIRRSLLAVEQSHSATVQVGLTRVRLLRAVNTSTGALIIDIDRNSWPWEYASRDGEHSALWVLDPRRRVKHMQSCDLRHGDDPA